MKSKTKINITNEKAGLIISVFAFVVVLITLIISKIQGSVETTTIILFISTITILISNMLIYKANKGKNSNENN